MNPTQLAAQANQAAQQGQQQYKADVGQANTSTSAYNTEHAQANAANSNLSSFADYMKGAGSGTNLYNTGLQGAESAIGFDPATLATATSNLTKSQNALAALNTASQSSTGGYGLSGAQLGGYYSSAAAPLSTQVGYQSGAVGNLKDLLTASQTQAGQYATAGLTGEQQTASALNQVFSNAQSQANQSLNNMQFYSQLAQTQGGLNATEQASYNAALNSYQQAKLAIAQSSQAYAQAGLLGSQAHGQNLANNVSQQVQGYTATPDNHGGFSYFLNGAPITREQYAAGRNNLGARSQV